MRHVKNDARAVINLSLGAFAGPHDGSSLLEQAIDSIAEQSNGRITFVVAAGNTGRVTDDGTRDAKRCHASFTLKADESRVLAWDIDRADSTESFLELWSPRVDGSAGLSVALAHAQNPELTSGEVGPDTVHDISRNGSVVAMVNNAGDRRPSPMARAGWSWSHSVTHAPRNPHPRPRDAGRSRSPIQENNRFR